MSSIIVSLRLNEEILNFIDKVCRIGKVDRSHVIQRMINYFWIRMVIYKDYEIYPPLDKIKSTIQWSANGVPSKKINIRLHEDTIVFIDNIAEKTHKSRSDIIRNIIEFFIITSAIQFNEKQPINFMDDLSH